MKKSKYKQKFIFISPKFESVMSQPIKNADVITSAVQSLIIVFKEFTHEFS